MLRTRTFRSVIFPVGNMETQISTFQSFKVDAFSVFCSETDFPGSFCSVF
jgi:hypothetical protein